MVCKSILTDTNVQTVCIEIKMRLLQIQDEINHLMSVFVTYMEGASVLDNTYANHLAETILVPLFRVVFALPNLRNLNIVQRNYPVIDLADDTAGVAIQVTGQNDSKKISKTIKGFVERKQYQKYDKLIVYILTRKKSYRVDFSALTEGYFSFQKKQDIKDFRDVLDVVKNFDVHKAQEVLQILKGNFDYLTTDSLTKPQLIASLRNPQERILSSHDSTSTSIYKHDNENLSFEQTIPQRKKSFVGRKQVLYDIKSTSTSTNVTVLLGLSGSGKTALMRELYSSFEEDSHAVFWYTFSAFTSLQDLLLSLSAFVDQHSNQPSQLTQLILLKQLPPQTLSDLLVRELNKRLYYIFLDALDKPKTQDNNISHFLQLLTSKLSSSKVFLASQSVPTFYTPVDVEQNHVREFRVDGLSQDEVVEFFGFHGYDNTSEVIELFPSYSKTLPMVLVLIQPMLSQGSLGLELREIVEHAEDRTIESIFEQVYKHLSDKERELLSTASCFVYPIAQHRLVQIHQHQSKASHVNITLRNLHYRILIQRIEPDYVRVHDIIRTMALKYVDDTQKLMKEIAEYLAIIEDAQPDDALHAILLFIAINEFDAASTLVVELGEGLITYMPDTASILFQVLTEDKLSRESWLWLLAMKGRYHKYWNEHGEAETTYLNFLNLARELGNNEAVSWAMQLLGTIYHSTDVPKSRKYYVDSLSIAKSQNDIIKQAELLTNLASLNIGEQRYQDAQEMFQKAFDLKKQANVPDWKLLAIYGNWGHLHYEQEEYEKADEYTLLARNIAEKENLPDELAQSDFNLGLHQQVQGNPEKALDYYKKSLETAEQHNLWHHKKSAYQALAELYLKQGDYDKAISNFNELANVNHDVKDYVDEAIAYFNIGGVISEQDKQDDAINYYERGLDLFEHLASDEELVGIFLERVVDLAVSSQDIAVRICTALKFVKRKLAKNTPSYALAKTYGSLGIIYLHLRKNRIGIACLCQEIELLDTLKLFHEKVAQQVNLSAHYESIGEISKGIVAATQVVESEIDAPRLKAMAHYNRANGYLTLQLFEQAESDFLAAIDLADESNEPAFLGSVRHNLGELYRRKNESEKAINLLQQSLTVVKQRKEVDGEISTLNNLGLAYHQDNQYEKAILHFEEGIQLAQKQYLKYDEARTFIGLGNLYSDRKQLDKAQEYYERAWKLAVEIEDDNLIEGSILSIGYARWRLGKFDEFEDEFERVGQRAADMKHNTNLLEFFKLSGQIELSRRNFKIAAEMFSQLFLISIMLGVDDLAEFDVIGVDASSKNFRNIFETINIICDWVDYTLQNDAKQDAKTFYTHLHKSIADILEGQINWVLPYIEPLDDYLSELPDEPAVYYVSQRWTTEKSQDKE